MKAAPKKTAVICWRRWPRCRVDRSCRFPLRRYLYRPGEHHQERASAPGSEWQGYRADVDHFYDAGDNVIAQGFYHGTYRATGKSFSASFAHIYTLRGGKIVKFVQIVDSAKVLEAMQP